MKPFHFLFLAGVSFMALDVYAQSGSVESALQKGNAKDLGLYFSGMVDVSVPGHEEYVTSSQAVKTLYDFFGQNPVKSYKRSHNSAVQEGRSGYSIGDLSTESGNYRVMLFYDTNKKIKGIRIQ